MDNKNEIKALREEVAKLNSHFLTRSHSSWWRIAVFQIYRGLFFGFGSVLGATLLVYIAIRLLSQIDFIPVIGDWVTEIIEIIGQK